MAAAATTPTAPNPPVDPNAPAVVDPNAPAAPRGLIGSNITQPAAAPADAAGGGTDASTTIQPPSTFSPSAPAVAPTNFTAQPASTYQPALGTVGNNETVSGQVDSLLNKDNPLLQTARNQAADAANARGLQNSSMGVQAGEQAVIENALPIAQADASTYHDTAVRNQEATNTGAQFNAGSQNQFGLSAQGATQQSGLSSQAAGEQSGLSAQAATQQSGLAQQQGQIQQVLQQMRGDQAVQVTNIEANYRTLMQTSASASQLYSQIVGTIGALLDDPNTTADQKQQAIDKQIQLLQSGMAAIGATGNVNLAGLLDFSQLNQPLAPAAPAAAPSPVVTPPASSGNFGDQNITGGA